ncbi:serine/threonine protein kinase [Cryptosporidium felis]|nr:serine/threonine protein kinase [Cryptosporidium felis]
MKLGLFVGILGLVGVARGEFQQVRKYNYGKDLCEFDLNSVLKRIPSLTDLSSGEIVQTHLDNESFKISKKGKEINSIELKEIIPPLATTPSTDQCFTMTYGADGEIETFCSDSVGARNYIMKKITMSILCLNLGNMRYEISGISPLEQQANMELQGNTPEEGSITVHLEGINEIPNIEVVTSSVKN